MFSLLPHVWWNKVVCDITYTAILLESQAKSVNFLADVNSRSRSLYAIGRPFVVCLSVVCL